MTISPEQSSDLTLPTPKVEVAPDTGEMNRDAIETLLERLGFRATPELLEAAGALVIGLTGNNPNGPTIKTAWIEYDKISEKLTEETKSSPGDNKPYTVAQIAAMLMRARIFKSAGNMIRYVEELDTAEILAFNKRLDEISIEIQRSIDNTIETMDMSPELLLIKLKGIISEKNRDFLRELLNSGGNLEDMINKAYAMIAAEDRDPSRTLIRLGVLEDQDEDES